MPNCHREMSSTSARSLPSSANRSARQIHVPGWMCRRPDDDLGFVLGSRRAAPSAQRGPRSRGERLWSAHRGGGGLRLAEQCCGHVSRPAGQLLDGATGRRESRLVHPVVMTAQQQVGRGGAGSRRGHDHPDDGAARAAAGPVLGAARIGRLDRFVRADDGRCRPGTRDTPAGEVRLHSTSMDRRGPGLQSQTTPPPQAKGPRGDAAWRGRTALTDGRCAAR